jgi:hypothetical protein
MESTATPKVMLTTVEYSGRVFGSEATRAIERAPLIPPRKATFFHEFGTPPISMLGRLRMG